MRIKQIRELPTVIDNTHESVLRAYQILEKVKVMLERGDSPDTVLELIDFMEGTVNPQEFGAVPNKDIMLMGPLKVDIKKQSNEDNYQGSGIH